MTAPEASAAWITDGKLMFAEVPSADDPIGLASWLTDTLALDLRHPIKGAAKTGVRGPKGMLRLFRVEAPSIDFERAADMLTPHRLRDIRAFYALKSDSEPFGYKAHHCDKLVIAALRLADVSAELTLEQEVAAIVATLLGDGDPVSVDLEADGAGQRYELARALRTVEGVAHYGVDVNTGELVMRASDVAYAARRYLGSSLARGWLPGAMQTAGFRRVRIEGHQAPGRAGRAGPRARIDAYRGFLAAAEDDEAVTT